MRRIIWILAATVYVSIRICPAIAQHFGSGKPIAFVGGCDVDLNKDGDYDSVLYISSERGYELIAIMRFKEEMKTYLLNRSTSRRHLKCQYGSRIKETDADRKSQGKVYEIDREFVTLLQPESSEVAYFWQDGEFKEVWLSD